MNTGVGSDQLQIWANQLVHAINYGLIFSFVAGLFLTILGIAFIVPAQQPQNSASWLGRQINPILCFYTIAAGTFLLSITAVASFSIEVLTGVSAGSSNPLYWGETNTRDEDELVRRIARLGMALLGLFVLVKGVFNMSKIGSQDPPKRPIGSTVGMFLLSAVFFVPNKVAGWLAGFIPFFNTVASVLEVQSY